MNIIYEPLTMEDSEEFFNLAGNEKVAATMRFRCPHDIEESNRILADYISEGNRTFALRFAHGEPLWGVFAFKGEPRADTADLSQMQVPEQWGKGLGNQVIMDMVELARKEKWYKSLGCYILETNTASRKMVERSGFTEKARHHFKGMNVDIVVYSQEL